MIDDDHNQTPLLLSYAQLVRLPNLFTAWADVAMGFLFTQPAPLEAGGVFGLLLAASSLLYMAGMVLNDLFDFDIDTKERPSRPLPSGRISVRAASALGFGMLFGGVACGWLASAQAHDVRPGAVASVLAVAVVAYDRILKRTPLGPLAMGSCRFLNVLLGMSTLDGIWQPVHYDVAAGLGIYIVGVTWFAKKEVGGSRPLALALATLVMWTGIAVLAYAPHWMGDPLPPDFLRGYQGIDPFRWTLFWGTIALLVGWRFWWAVFDPEPKHIQAAVRYALFSLVLLNAAMAFARLGLDPPYWPVVILTLLIPTTLLGQWVYST